MPLLTVSVKLSIHSITGVGSGTDSSSGLGALSVESALGSDEVTFVSDPANYKEQWQNIWSFAWIINIIQGCGERVSIQWSGEYLAICTNLPLIPEAWWHQAWPATPLLLSSFALLLSAFLPPLFSIVPAFCKYLQTIHNEHCITSCLHNWGN